MSKLKGTNIASPIVPYTDSDIYPTHLAKYGKGGYRTVQNYEELINIPESRLEEGMLVYLIEDNRGHNFYQYKNGVWEVSDIENSNVLDIYNPDDRIYDVKVEGDYIKVRNEVGDVAIEGTPAPGHFSYLKINSFYLGQYGGILEIVENKHNYLPCSHTFIELANTSSVDASLNGLYLMTYNGTTWNKLKLTGIIPANSTYLIRGEQCSVINSDTTYIKVTEFNQEWLNPGTIRVKNNNGFTAYLCWCTDDGKIIGNNGVQKDFPETYGDIYSTTNPSYIDCVSVGNNNRYSTGGKNIEDSDSFDYISKKIFVRRYPMDPAYVDTKDCRIDWRWHYIEDDRYKPAATYEKKNLDWGTSWMRYDKPLTLTCTVGESVHVNTRMPDGSEKPASRCFTWVSPGLNDEYLFIRRVGASSWAHFGSLHGGSRLTMVTNYAHEAEPEHGWIKANESISLLNLNNTLFRYYNRCQWETYSGDVLTTHRTIAYCETPGEYEYCCGKMLGGYPDPNFITEIQTIKIYEVSDAPTETITVGNQFIGNQEDGECWWTVSNKIVESIQNETIKEPALVVCTGNMVNNGNRPGEWVTYINNDVLHRHYAEFITPGTNDFGGNNLYELFDGNEKISPTMFSLFYTFEIPTQPELRLTIPTGTYKDTSNYYTGSIIVPGFYVSYFGSYALCSLNSAITTSEKSTICNVYRMVEETLLHDTQWSKVDYGESRSADETDSSIFFRRVMNWFMNNFVYYLNGNTEFRDLDDASSLYGWYLTKFPEIDLYENNISPLVKARRFIVLTNYPPISPVDNFVIERRNTDDCTDRMGKNIYKDNLNSRLFFGLSRLFKCLNIHYVIGSSSFASTLISRPIFDAQGEDDKSAAPFSALADFGNNPKIANTILFDDLSNNLFGSDTFHPVVQCMDEDTLSEITAKGFRKLINDTQTVVMNIRPRKTFISNPDGILDIYYFKPEQAAADYDCNGLVAEVAPIYLLLGTSTTKFSIDGNSFANIHPSLLGGGLVGERVNYGSGGWFNSANNLGNNCTPTAFLIKFDLRDEMYPYSSELTDKVTVRLLSFNMPLKVSNANDYKLYSYWNSEIRKLSSSSVPTNIIVSNDIPLSSVNGD